MATKKTVWVSADGDYHDTEEKAKQADRIVAIQQALEKTGLTYYVVSDIIKHAKVLYDILSAHFAGALTATPVEDDEDFDEDEGRPTLED